ncbi:hypothetical protein F5Y12DRAFT_774549 [Xylaria sp. FL1777]|nr:hypothetical protein F5Y12DRAFT_774549 [Xylaria sp. FL1777]
MAVRAVAITLAAAVAVPSPKVHGAVRSQDDVNIRVIILVTVIVMGSHRGPLISGLPSLSTSVPITWYHCPLFSHIGPVPICICTSTTILGVELKKDAVIVELICGR